MGHNNAHLGSESEDRFSQQSYYAVGFFVACAGPDTGLAEDLFEQLKPHVRVFLDSKGLLLGDNWGEKLRDAKTAFLVSVILASSNTEKANYQRAEIAAVTNMARDEQAGHRAMPVYVEDTAAKSVTCGLRLKHGLVLKEPGNIHRAANEPLRLLAQLKGEEVQATSEATDLVMPSCQYMGLSHFNEQDATLFFGRETFTNRLFEAISNGLLLATRQTPSR